ncbi:hypothetical protein KDD17_10835 [Sulfitobacter albidus]|uniref:Uncharacterized protein n=1 Tax=Sulfitobacter albidus TaxID=2829501 RepID=A0A975PL91_9RHOB|nr:hypothetical protein [Sulfitobacter albidus]QUJ75468.1 hypothetical protein KDD17_10835 [Sulfitobacter albidus]
MNDAFGGTEQAMAIYQDLLDRISDSYKRRDFSAFAQMVAVPHAVRSFGPTAWIEDRTQLRALFDDICTHQAANAITDYDRHCLAARFTAEDTIDGTHETRMLRGAQIAQDPYPVRSVLRRINGVWWVTESDNAIEPDAGLGAVLSRRATPQNQE